MAPVSFDPHHLLCKLLQKKPFYFPCLLFLPASAPLHHQSNLSKALLWRLRSLTQKPPLSVSVTQNSVFSLHFYISVHSFSCPLKNLFFLPAFPINLFWLFLPQWSHSSNYSTNPQAFSQCLLHMKQGWVRWATYGKQVPGSEAKSEFWVHSNSFLFSVPNSIYHQMLFIVPPKYFSNPLLLFYSV